MHFCFWILVAIGLLAPHASLAAESEPIDRSIKKEPAYRTQPKYCLLVFGAQRQPRIWLVQDGDVLYVDRNGNGDLTEAGEKVLAGKDSDRTQGHFIFEAGDVPDGSRRYKGLQVQVWRVPSPAPASESHGYFLRIDVAMPGLHGGGAGGRVEQIVQAEDVRGSLQFADEPQKAPIIHLGGPLQITLTSAMPLRAGRDIHLRLAVGTPGTGPGTTAYVGYEGLIPEKAHPTVEILYPPEGAGEPPLRQRYELKERC